MMRYSLLTTILLFWSGFIFSQVPKQSDSFDGTYQIMVTDSKKQPVFTTDIIVEIEARRKDHEDVMYPVQEGVNIYIPSRDKINSPDFKSLELYSY